MKEAHTFADLAKDFSLKPFDTQLQPLIDEVLIEQGKDTCRKGTLLIPRLLVWLVLVLTLRRDLNYDKALNWMLSGLRWMAGWLPAQSKLVSDGAISHARVKLRAEVFWALFAKQSSAVAAAFIVLNSVSGLAGRVLGGNFVMGQFGLMLIPFGLIGALSGSWLGAQRLSSLNLRRVLGIVMSIAVTNYWWKLLV